MSAPDLKQKIHDALRSHFFNGSGDLVDVSDAPDDSFHVLVVSRKLDGMQYQEKHDLIWDLLTANLTCDEWAQISLTIATTPEEIIEAH